MAQRTIKASEFKAKCPKLMDDINESGDTLTVTKNGRPVVEVRPAVRKRKSLWGSHAGQGQTLGDIVSPVLDESEAFE